MKKSSLNSMKKRIYGMTVCVLAVMVALIFRIGYWQIVRGDEMKARVQSQQQSASVVTASRGKIYDRNGKVLAESASANNLVCNPQSIKTDEDAKYIAGAISGILDLEYDDVYEALTRKKYQYSIIKKKLTADESEQIEILMSGKETKSKFAGLYFEADSKRFYPYNIAPHILGWVNAENNGASGVESTFDDSLSGKAGSITTTVTGTGAVNMENPSEELKQAGVGNDVVLTIDETIQHYLENHLEKALKENKLKQGATGIVMNPKTGEILAMATKPDFDNNNYADYERFAELVIDYEAPTPTPTPIPEDDDEDDEDDEDEVEATPTPTPVPTFDPKNPSDLAIADMRNRMWRNKSVTDTYEPGSTFKVITAAAALEEHIVDETTPFYCPGFKVVEDREIGCANTDGHGAQTFKEGVQNSCNPVFMEVALKLGEDKFMEYFRSFGFTEKTGIELNGESGSIYYTNGMNRVDIATSSFGQGFQITPLQLITAVSAVINGGERMKPHIVKEVRNSEGVVQSFEPEVVTRVISEETSDKMRSILESVISTPGATGKNAYVKGWRIGGKTATSEKMPRGTDARIASFIGFAPANDPEIICLVVFDEPQVANKYGGTIAAPVVGEIIDETLEYLGTERQYNDDEEPDVKIEVPDVRGLSLDEAKERIVDAGFKYTISGDRDLDEIVAQLPKPGVVMGEKSLVILYTEEKEETVTVPDLRGLSVSAAKETLLIRNLNFEVAGAGHSNVRGAYAVNQSIDANTKVAPGTVIGVEFRQEAID